MDISSNDFKKLLAAAQVADAIYEQSDRREVLLAAQRSKRSLAVLIRRIMEVNIYRLSAEDRVYVESITNPQG